MNTKGVFCCFCFLLSSVYSFNFFPRHAQVFTNNNPASYFGFSVLLQASAGGHSARVVVGAPRDNSTYNLHKNINEPGSVYSCPVNQENCQQFLLYLNGNIRDKTSSGIQYMHKKDHGWLGCSIDGEDYSSGQLVACAPRWKNQIHLPYYYLQNGICYYLQNSSNVEKGAQSLLPLIDPSKQGFNGGNDSVYYYALGETGMSVHITKKESDILLGSPGVLQWTGMVVKYYNENSRSQNTYNKMEIPNPHFINTIGYFSYFGYAVSSGKFNKSSDQISYVAGAPRGKNLLGQVFVYEYIKGKNDLKILFEMNGMQDGEYFGSTISVGDINGDGADDILVGAPMYSTESKFDVGRVFVFMNNGQGIFNSMIINGPQMSRARFGSAISVIGDVNKDGFSDVVVGAPFYDEGRGAIFLYFGSKTGITEQYSQLIRASDVDSNLKGFGASISRGVDVDNNNYNDVAVGAYASGHAIILKSRPVVNIQPSLFTDSRQISIETKSFEISACVKYDGKHLPNMLNMKLTINADPDLKRVLFDVNHGTKWDMSKVFKYNENMCQNLKITIVNTKSDFTQPITFEMTHTLVEAEDDGKFCATCPVIDKTISNKTMLSIPYETGCGTDEICQTNLILKGNFTYNKPYLVIGAEDNIDIKVEINNSGEPAFASKFYAVIPSVTSFIRVPDICQQITNNVLLCEVGNPLSQKKKVMLTLPIDVSQLNNNDRLIVYMNVTSLGTETDTSDNSITLEKPLKTEVEISVIGISSPEQFMFVDENKILKQDNFTFTHQYTVQNLGPSPLDDLVLTFLIPQRLTENGANIIQVYKPDAPQLKCTTRNSEGYYQDENNDLPQIEAEFPEEETEEIANLRLKRSTSEGVHANTFSNNLLYTELQKRTGSDSEIPPNLPLNRTLSMRCTSPDSVLKCMEVICVAGLMKRGSQVAVNFKLLANLTLLDEMRGEKDIVVVTSSVLPTSQYFNVNSTYTHTVFQGSIRPESPLKWIILGTIFAIILWCFITYGLYRAGFFKRQNREKLMNEQEEVCIADEDELKDTNDE